MFPKDKEGFAIDDQFFVGSSGLLVKPVTEQGATEATIYLPENQVIFKAFTRICTDYLIGLLRLLHQLCLP